MDSEDKIIENETDGQEFDIELARSSTAAAHPRILSKKEDTTIAEPEGQLTIDVYQTPTHIIIESAVAGVSPEDLDIHVSSDNVTIRGERKKEKTIKTEDYLYQECYWGKFSRSVILPQDVDADAAAASFKNGVLRIELPKLSRTKTKKLKVHFD